MSETLPDFRALGIDEHCARVLDRRNITQPTPVQLATIPPALEGRDLIGIAQTGTGKTLAFGLAALTRLGNHPVRHTRILVLAPTRELAVQVHEVLEPLAHAQHHRTACVYGGVGMDKQAKALRHGAAVVVATPGRLLDHIQRGSARLDHVEILILDEGDRMLDMGFMPDIKRIVAELPTERQTLMFSATFPTTVERFSAELQRDAQRIQVGAAARPAELVRQALYTVHQDRKQELLEQVLQHCDTGPTVVFLRTKHRTDRIAKALSRAGIDSEAIHGGRSQAQRTRTLDGFRRGKFRVLVATDVAARGLDVPGITHVINFDIPNSSDDYIHRIGRTARNQADGDAITFVSPGEQLALRDIERALGHAIPRTEWEGSVAIGGAIHSKPNGRGNSNGNSRDGGQRAQRNDSLRPRRDFAPRDRNERPDRGEQTERSEQPRRDYAPRERAARPDQAPRQGAAGDNRRPARDGQRPNDRPYAPKRNGAWEGNRDNRKERPAVQDAKPAARRESNAADAPRGERRGESAGAHPPAERRSFFGFRNRRPGQRD